MERHIEEIIGGNIKATGKQLKVTAFECFVLHIFDFQIISRDTTPSNIPFV